MSILTLQRVTARGGRAPAIRRSPMQNALRNDLEGWHTGGDRSIASFGEPQCASDEAAPDNSFNSLSGRKKSRSLALRGKATYCAASHRARPMRKGGVAPADAIRSRRDSVGSAGDTRGVQCSLRGEPECAADQERRRCARRIVRQVLLQHVVHQRSRLEAKRIFRVFFPPRILKRVLENSQGRPSGCSMWSSSCNLEMKEVSSHYT